MHLLLLFFFILLTKWSQYTCMLLSIICNREALKVFVAIPTHTLYGMTLKTNTQTFIPVVSFVQRVNFFIALYVQASYPVWWTYIQRSVIWSYLKLRFALNQPFDCKLYPVSKESFIFNSLMNDHLIPCFVTICILKTCFCFAQFEKQRLALVIKISRSLFVYLNCGLNRCTYKHLALFLLRGPEDKLNYHKNATKLIQCTNFRWDLCQSI